MVISGYLVEVEYANIEEIRKNHPEAFRRQYDPAAGLRMERILDTENPSPVSKKG